ncbi:class F sortase [Candidatus Saccharibacteria bacterium]|nr:class F sortase [Candidatus Saccharibacteria bacterium]
MSLELGVSWKRIVKWVVVVLLVALVAGFFLRVLIWEDGYYREMEGSERDIVETAKVEEPEELVEVAPTEEEVYEYIVAPDMPRYLRIDKLGITGARIIPMGINDDGALATPNNIFDVGWYESSGKPGQGGTLVIDGHNGGPNVYGVFKNLPNLEVGDIIVVERGDGEVFEYSVVENVEVSLDEADTYMATAMRSPESGKESVTLISCTGEWSNARYTYLSRQFTRAVLI